jgi:hypothetical protein
LTVICVVAGVIVPQWTHPSPLHRFVGPVRGRPQATSNAHGHDYALDVRKRIDGRTRERRAMSEVEYLPSIEQIAQEFASEIELLKGNVIDSVADAGRLYMRALVPGGASPRAGDLIRWGVAIRVSGPDVGVYPFTYRTICTNGAIQVESIASHMMSRVATERVLPAAATGALSLGELSAAVRACAAPEVFTAILGTLRSATEHRVSVMLHLLPMLARLPTEIRSMIAGYLRAAVEQFNADQDESLYGLVNAVTAIARTAPDPEARWQLEVIGAALLVQQSERQVERAMRASAAGQPF